MRAYTIPCSIFQGLRTIELRLPLPIYHRFGLREMSSASLPSQRFALGSAQGGSLGSLFSQAGIGMFLLGVASGTPIQAVGRLYVGEILLMGISPIVAILLFGISSRYGSVARILLTAMIVSWIGYLISDMIRGTASLDYLRGWSRWIAMGSSFAALAWLGSKNIGYMSSFLVGMSVGNCFSPFVMGAVPGPILFWKFYAGVPVCIIALVIASSFRPWMTVITLIGLTVLSLLLDTRFVALLCMITAGVTMLSARRSAKANMPLAPISKSSMIITGVFLGAFMLMAFLIIQFVGQRYGYTERFQRSNSARLADAIVSWRAIKASPMIGYGSWPRNAELARERDRLVAKFKGSPASRTANQENLIISHSQIIQGWVEGGILGVAFFGLTAWLLGRQLLWQTFMAPYTPLTALIVFVQLQCGWNLVFSPFSGAQRLYIPSACVFICYTAQQASQLTQLRNWFALSWLGHPAQGAA
jgi:hypothetical protein